MTLTRSEAAQEILERVFGFETQFMYALQDGQEPQIFFPEIVQNSPELVQRFTDPQTGNLIRPNQLCILVPDETDLEVNLSTYLTEDRGLSRESALENPTLEDSPEIVPTESWRPAPDVFANEAVQNRLTEHYRITVQPQGNAWRAESATGEVAIAPTRGEAVVACVLTIKGLPDVQIVDDR
ncbi:MAG TPA: hypothetical protein VFS50_15175 [Meiothermus sp.]|jgi:hypothetical protein|nr:hypothetical protein [Meiothermus sp.]